MTDQDEIWIGVTVVPDGKVAHAQAFTNPTAVRDYVEAAREKAPDGVDVWVSRSRTELKEEYTDADE